MDISPVNGAPGILSQQGGKNGGRVCDLGSSPRGGIKGSAGWVWKDAQRVPVGKQSEGRENFTGGENGTKTKAVA